MRVEGGSISYPGSIDYPPGLTVNKKKTPDTKN